MQLGGSHQFEPAGAFSRCRPNSSPCSTSPMFPRPCWQKTAEFESAGIACAAGRQQLWFAWTGCSRTPSAAFACRCIEQDAAAARAILDEPIPPEFSEEDVGESYAQPRCPRCYSLDIGFERINRFWTYGLWLLLSFPIPVRKNNWKCYTCGSEWVEE